MINNKNITLANIAFNSIKRGSWRAAPQAVPAEFKETSSPALFAIDPITFTLKPNAAGDQLTSDPDGLAVPGITLPTPTNFVVDNVTDQIIYFSWSAVNDPNVDGFEIEINEDGAGWVTAQTQYYGPDARSGSSSGLAADTYYGHRCRAAKDNGDGTVTVSTWSNEAWQTTDEAIVLPPPTGGTTNLAALPVFENFERFANGTKFTDATPSSQWGACDNLTVDTSRPYPGLTRSGHSWLEVGNSYDPQYGSTGWGWWGYDCRYAPSMAHGSEMWWRQAFYWPSDTDMRTGIPQLKTFKKVRTIQGQSYSHATSVGLTPNGHFPIGHVSASGGNLDPPGTNTTWWQWQTPVPLGRWYMMEVYHKFDSDPYGGRAVVWIDGVYIGDVVRATMETAAEYIGNLYMHTYWNGGIESTRGQYQECWYSQIAVAGRGPTTSGSRDDTPNMDYDPVSGLPFIGMAVA